MKEEGNTCAPMACQLIKHCENFFKEEFHPHSVNSLADTKDDTAAVSVKSSHCYYITTFRKKSKAD